MDNDREFKIEIPAVGTISSDSGNHLVDIISVVGVVLLIFMLKRYVWNKN